MTKPRLAPPLGEPALGPGCSVCPRCGNTIPGEATQDCVVCAEPAKEFLAF